MAIAIFFFLRSAIAIWLKDFPAILERLLFNFFSETLDEEKKEREHLLALNQVIAQQVLQKRRSLPGM